MVRNSPEGKSSFKKRGLGGSPREPLLTDRVSGGEKDTNCHSTERAAVALIATVSTYVKGAERTAGMRSIHFLVRVSPREFGFCHRLLGFIAQRGNSR